MTRRRAALGSGRRCRLRLASMLGLPLSLLLLTGCSSNNDGDQPTVVAPPTTAATTVSTVPVAATPAPAAATQRAAPAGQLVGDNICQARVPTSWVEESAGTGTMPGGHRFSIWGNHLASPEAWVAAVSLFKQTAARQTEAQIEEGPDSVRIIYPDGGGFAYRAYFGDRYCDVRVTARGGSLPASDQAIWDQIITSLGPSASAGAVPTETGGTSR